MIRAEQRQIDKIIAARDTELARARENNDGMKSEWAADTQENSSYAMGFAGLGEAVCLFCLIFIGIYDDGIKKQVRGVTLRTHDVTPIHRPTISPQRNAPALVTAEKRPEIMRELREKQAQQAQPEQGQNQVATRVYAATDSLETAAQIKVDQRTLRAYRHKLRNGIGNPVTNQTHIDRLEAKIEDMKAQLG
jgi:hypothetical protein